MKLRVKRHAVTQPLSESYRLIPLTQNRNAIVDVEDFERLNKWNWQAKWSPASKTFYAKRGLTGGASTWMHNEIIKTLPGQQPDHKNRNGLDNRKENLRVGTRSENMANRTNPNNTSGYRGVVWVKRDSKWQAQIKVHGNTIYLGYFSTREDAGRAYDKIATRYFGEFAQLNFP